MVAACGILCCGFSSSWSGVELRVMRPVKCEIGRFHPFTGHEDLRESRGIDLLYFRPLH